MTIYRPPKMMPGQAPYTEEELKRLEKLVHEAASEDPGEENEREVLKGALSYLEAE